MRICLFPGVLLFEFAHSALGIHDLLLAGVKGMAGGADFYMEFLIKGRTCDERVSTGAYDLDLLVFRMNIGFHGEPRDSKKRQRIIWDFERLNQPQNPLSFHRLEKLRISLCRTQLVKQKLNSLNIVHGVEQLT